MRNFLLALVLALVGCEWWCPGPLPPMDDGEDSPAPPAPATQAPAPELVPDAMQPDAAMPDAALPDATLPDATLPDATLPDATLPDADHPAAKVTVFTWTRNGAALPEQTRQLRLVARCVDRNGAALPFFQPPESRTYEGEEQVNAVERIDLTIPNGPDYCYVLLEQNENQTPFGGHQPGSGTYVLNGVVYNAPLLDARPFAGFWEVDLHAGD